MYRVIYTRDLIKVYGENVKITIWIVGVGGHIKTRF